MNSIASILSMIESNAQDYCGLQEIPEHRVGPEYRFSVAKRLARQNLPIHLKNSKCIFIPNIHDNQEEVTVHKQNYILSQVIEDDGSLWYRVEQG